LTLSSSLLLLSILLVLVSVLCAAGRYCFRLIAAVVVDFSLLLFTHTHTCRSFSSLILLPKKKKNEKHYYYTYILILILSSFLYHNSSFPFPSYLLLFFARFSSPCFFTCKLTLLPSNVITPYYKKKERNFSLTYMQSNKIKLRHIQLV
jgi:hypothetical protein